MSELKIPDKATAKELLVLREELLGRRLKDPLRNFVPHAKQRAFIDATLEDNSGETWFIAANRSGKSDAGAYIGASLARFGNQGARYVGAAGSRVQVRDTATSGWVVALDFPSSRDIIQPKYFNNNFVPPNATHEPFIPDREVEEWRVGDQILKLKNGSIIGFKSCESGGGKFQGAGKEWIHFDEEPPVNIYEECSIRIEGNVKLRIFGTCTILPPEGQAGGVSWLFEKKIEPWRRGEGSGVRIFGASIYDNPHVLKSELERLEGIYPEGSIARRIRLNGELLPGLSGARAYPAYNGVLNIRKGLEIDPRRPLCWALDFNVEPMCSLIGQKFGAEYRVFKELVIDEGSVSDMCQYFYDYIPHHLSEVWVYGDATSKRRSGQTGQSDYTIIQNEMRAYGCPIRIRVPESNPHVPDRINAVNVALNSRGTVNLLIDPGCRELISDLEQVLRDGRGGIKKTSNKKDPYFRRTHTSDALGYWISYESPVRLLTLPQAKVSVHIPTPSYGN
ncbi:MAG: hypothetical protein C5B59_17205 [Bacteroidetes bacterium]|nr:MAG: hypothetical protein C5B59_17205 [Bacteroidota bacterium]